MLHKVSKVLSTILKPAIAIILIALILLTFSQVVSRTFFNRGITWAEELSRHLFVWGVFLGLSLCVREDSTIKITVLTDFLSKKIGISEPTLWIKWLGSLFIFVILAWFGIKFTMVGSGSGAQLLPYKMSTVYVAIPVSGILCILFTIDEIIEHYKQRKKGGEN